jgi:glucose-6-phosphate isomerase
MLHQGSDVIPVEFILVKTPSHPHADLHTKLLANGLAQSQALMLGKTVDVARDESAPTASPNVDPDALARQRSFPGNRPSTTLLLDALTPRSLGALIALYEHRVFTSGALWGITSSRAGIGATEPPPGHLTPTNGPAPPVHSPLRRRRR